MFNISSFIEQLLLRLNLRDENMFRPIRPEEGEGYTANAILFEAQRRAAAAVLQGQITPPSAGEQHNVFIAIYESVLALLQALGINSEGLTQLIVLTQQAQLQEEENTGTNKLGTKLPPEPKLDTLPTRASAAAQTQGRVQNVGMKV